MIGAELRLGGRGGGRLEKYTIRIYNTNLLPSLTMPFLEVTLQTWRQHLQRKIDLLSTHLQDGLKNEINEKVIDRKKQAFRGAIGGQRANCHIGRIDIRTYGCNL